jgi:hypothetical protein
MTQYLARKSIRPTKICVFPPSDRPTDCSRRCFTPRCLPHNAVLTGKPGADDLELVRKEIRPIPLFPC